MSRATSRIVARHGSRTSKILRLLRPDDGGRSSYMFAIRDAVMEGNPQAGSLTIDDGVRKGSDVRAE